MSICPYLNAYSWILKLFEQWLMISNHTRAHILMNVGCLSTLICPVSPFKGMMQSEYICPQSALGRPFGNIDSIIDEFVINYGFPGGWAIIRLCGRPIRLRWASHTWLFQSALVDCTDIHPGHRVNGVRVFPQLSTKEFNRLPCTDQNSPSASELISYQFINL